MSSKNYIDRRREEHTQDAFPLDDVKNRLIDSFLFISGFNCSSCGEENQRAEESQVVM